MFKGRHELFEREQRGLKGGIGVLGTAKDLVRLERNSGRLVGVVMVWYSLNRGWGKVG